MTRQNRNKSLYKKLHHRTINATYQSKRSMIVMLAIIFMVCIHMFVLGGYDSIFNKQDIVPIVPAKVDQELALDVIDVAPPVDDFAVVKEVKPARVNEGYIYPLFAEYYPYDADAEDELKVKMPYVDGALKTAKPVYQYALKNTSSQTARIAIMIDDVGMNRKQSRAVVEMDEVPLTLAFLPYAPDLKSLTEPALAAGHELMIHMPMEPMSSKVPLGPIAIRDAMSADEIKTMLNKAYASFDGYTGLNNHMGSRATQNKTAMDVVMASLGAHGLFYVDSKTISTSVAADAARDNGLAYAERDVFLDHEETLEFARNALVKLEQVALNKGYAIAIGHPKKHTVAALKEWIPTLKARGFEIVPVSELLMHPDKSKAANVAKVARVDSIATVEAKSVVKKNAAPVVKDAVKDIVRTPKFILEKPDVSAVDIPKIEPAVGVEDTHVVAADLLRAPIGVGENFKTDVTDGLYSLSR